MLINGALQFLHTLSEIGLSAREANIYMLMLQLGKNPASTIAKTAQLNRSTCYSLLNNLSGKGFCLKTIKNHVTYFSPVKPKLLLEKLQDKKTALDNKISNITDIIDQFEKIHDDDEKKPSVTFFENVTNINNVFEDSLMTQDIIRIYLNPFEIEKILPGFFKIYNSRRIKKGIIMNAIYPANQTSFMQKKEFKDQIHLIPPSLAFAIAIIIYDNKTVIISLKDQFGILIKSNEMTAIQKSIFDIIWQSTEKHDEIMTKIMQKKFCLLTTKITLNKKKPCKEGFLL